MLHSVVGTQRFLNLTSFASNRNHSVPGLIEAKSIFSRLYPPRSAIILAGLDENQAWGAPNFQPAPQLDAGKSAFLAYFYK
jgi:hypothetical protein